MTERIALGGLVASVASVGAAYAAVLATGGAPVWAPAAMVVGIAGSVVALMVLAAARGGRVGRLRAPFAFVFVVLVAGFGAALVMSPAESPSPELWLGLPPRAAVVLYGVGLVTLAVVPAAYAATFDELALTDEDWRRVRRRAAREDDGGQPQEATRPPPEDAGGSRPPARTGADQDGNGGRAAR